MPSPPKPVPTANMLLVDVDDWDEILHGCASAASMDINTSLIWDESINSGLNKLSNFMRCLPLVGQVIGGMSYARHGEYWSVGGNAAVDFTNAKYRADRDNFYTMFETNLAKEMALGPQAAVKYIQSRVDLARSAMSNVHYKFREAGKINDEVSHAWDVGIRRLDTMQVVINATLARSWPSCPAASSSSRWRAPRTPWPASSRRRSPGCPRPIRWPI
jgi:hypothetical protein